MVVEDRITEMEDGGFVDDDAVGGVAAVVMGGVGVFDAGGGISDGAHVCEKDGQMCVTTEEKRKKK